MADRITRVVFGWRKRIQKSSLAIDAQFELPVKIHLKNLKAANAKNNATATNTIISTTLKLLQDGYPKSWQYLVKRLLMVFIDTSSLGLLEPMLYQGSLFQWEQYRTPFSVAQDTTRRKNQ